MIPSFIMRLSLFILIVMVISLCDVSGSNQLSKSRVRRHVLFTKSSKYFFRFNGKLNTLNYTTLVACGYTVRMNWNLPHDTKNRFLFFKRDIHEELRNIPDEFATKGFSCVLSHVCQLVSNIQKFQCGFFCEIGKLISRESGLEANFLKNLVSRCDYYQEICPHYTSPTVALSYG